MDKVHSTPTYVDGKLNTDKATAVAALRKRMHETLPPSRKLVVNGRTLSPGEAKVAQTQAPLKDMKAKGALEVDAVDSHMVSVEEAYVRRHRSARKSPDFLYDSMERSAKIKNDVRHFVQTNDGRIVIIDKVPAPPAGSRRRGIDGAFTTADDTYIAHSLDGKEIPPLKRAQLEDAD